MTARTYLVGGAVRDEMLGLQARERDWVVVGGTPDSLLAEGFQQVGSSFPVFLHPQTNEEYALARTERKAGHGYHGFTVDFHPDVTLEQDLERRDLTINAMAQDEAGTIIDPFNGRADIDARVLRHVSGAFAEDPLRVLRVARFAARFAPLGFTIHASTMDLMREMTDSGELDHLVPERVWSEIRNAMSAAKPSVFVQTLRDCGALKQLLPEVDALFGVPQTARYHPEIDAGVHVQLAMDLAASEGWSDQVVFALLLHDLGKAVTEPSRLPAHHGHEKAGLPLVENVCQRYRVPQAYRDLALAVCELHLKCHRLLELRPEKVMNLIEKADLLRRPQRLEALLQACEADYRGRKGLQHREYPQAERLRCAVAAVNQVTVKDLAEQGLDLSTLEGPEIGRRLRQARVASIADAIDDNVSPGN